jgi:hypothetical protein
VSDGAIADGGFGGAGPGRGPGGVGARGGPLDPNAFTSLGTLNITSGSSTFNTTTDQLLDSSNNVLFTRVTYNGIAVFTFSGVTISGGAFTATGSNPLALLPQGNIIFTVCVQHRR